MIADTKDNLYSTTRQGGGTGCGGYGCGTVFKLMPDGTETVLYSFTGGSDGAYPKAGVIADAKGHLYGTTFPGGGTGCQGFGCGVVFKLAPDGTLTVLHSFTGGDDGGYINAGLIADANSNLYGITTGGGCGGTVFELKE
jgi:uncharacterized repeat protein (TIGR03803 family)